MISIRGLKKKLGEKQVLNGVDLDIHTGESIVIMGRSGTGKSVLLKHIVGLLMPDSGQVIVDDMLVSALPRDELSKLRQRIGYAFQMGALFDSMSVYENIRLGITNEDQYRDKSFCDARVAEVLKQVNLSPDVAKKMPAALSGGMKKRVGIARAIAGKPSYMLYDEPTSGLDPVNADAMDALIEQLQHELNVTSVVVSHDVRGSFKVADRIALLHHGKIRKVGTAEDFMNAKDEVVREFLDRDFQLLEAGQ